MPADLIHAISEIWLVGSFLLAVFIHYFYSLFLFTIFIHYFYSLFLVHLFDWIFSLICFLNHHSVLLFMLSFLLVNLYSLNFVLSFLHVVLYSMIGIFRCCVFIHRWLLFFMHNWCSLILLFVPSFMLVILKILNQRTGGQTHFWKNIRYGVWNKIKKLDSNMYSVMYNVYEAYCRRRI